MCIPASFRRRRRRSRGRRRFLGAGVGGVDRYIDGLIAEADRTNDPSAHRDAARLCVVHHRPDDAVRCLERCVRADAVDANDLSLLGVLHADALRHEQARACFLRSAALLAGQSVRDERRRTADDLRRAAACSYELGDVAAAVAQYSDASRLYRACAAAGTSRVLDAICDGAADRCALALAKLLVAGGRARDAAFVVQDAYSSVATGPILDELIVVDFACRAIGRSPAEAVDSLSGVLPHRAAARYLRSVLRGACADPPPTDHAWSVVVLDDVDAPSTGVAAGEPSAQSLLLAVDRDALRRAVAARTRRPAKPS